MGFLPTFRLLRFHFTKGLHRFLLAEVSFLPNYNLKKKRGIVNQFTKVCLLRLGFYQTRYISQPKDDRRTQGNLTLTLAFFPKKEIEQKTETHLHK